MIVLDKVFRQKDSGFLRLLNELRRGIVSQETITILKRKVEDNKEKEKAMKSSGFIKSSVLSAVTTGTGTGGGGGGGDGKEEIIVRPTKLYATNRLQANLPSLSSSSLSFPLFSFPSFPFLFFVFLSFVFFLLPFPLLSLPFPSFPSPSLHFTPFFFPSLPFSFFNLTPPYEGLLPLFCTTLPYDPFSSTLLYSTLLDSTRLQSNLHRPYSPLFLW